jgi:hypothetical protein
MGRLIKLLLSSFPKARIKPALSRHDGELVHTPWKIRAAMEENKQVQINRRKVFE